MSTPIPPQYFEQRSSFKTIVESESSGWQALMVERVHTSAGYNTSSLPRHMIGVHLGAPVYIFHQREHGEKLHHFQAGDVIFTPAGGSIYYVHPQLVDALYIALDPLAMNHFAETAGFSPEQLHFQDQLGKSDPILARIGQAFLAELIAPGLGSRLYIEALTQQLILHLLRHYTGVVSMPRPTPMTRLQPALDYIHAHLGENLSIEQIAGSVHLTPYHFSRVFKQQLGLSPHQYVIQKRLEAARHLLQDPRLTLAEIARQVGFADHSHLTRHYKRWSGKPPRTH